MNWRHFSLYHRSLFPPHRHILVYMPYDIIQACSIYSRAWTLPDKNNLSVTVVCLKTSNYWLGTSRSAQGGSIADASIPQHLRSQLTNYLMTVACWQFYIVIYPRLHLSVYHRLLTYILLNILPRQPPRKHIVYKVLSPENNLTSMQIGY